MKLRVNGLDHEVDVPNDMPLLWVLRDVLGLTGTKFGCGIAQCGACTVHLDGEATRSCVLPASAVGTKSVTTIEALFQHPDDPLRKAWIDEQVPQCGYCQPGQLMAISSLLKKTPKPDDATLASEITNICRCCTYDRIRRGVERATGQAS